MPRTLNPIAHAVRRDAFLDVAQRLIQSKGYEQMSVQDVLDELGASKGAFYHYFDSKEALLAAVVDRMVAAAVGGLAPLATAPDLTPLQKIEALFAGLASWKAERKDLVVALLRVWFRDDNAIMRDKLRQGMVVRITPLLAAIIRQGKANGQFSATFPEDAAGVLVSLWLGVDETAGQLFIAHQANAVAFEVFERTFAAYTEAFERVLGLSAGSLTIVDGPTLRQWFG